ncbi:MAG: MtrB/PioB family decaheme-associated outer membrane protein [Thiotrichales bacterium]
MKSITTMYRFSISAFALLSAAVNADELPGFTTASETVIVEAVNRTAPVDRWSAVAWPEWEAATPEPQVTGRIEVGVGHVADDTVVLGRHGFDAQGSHGVAEVELEARRGALERIGLKGEDLGTQNRAVRLEAERQGLRSGYLQLEQLPNIQSATAATPYAGVGSDDLTLDTNARLQAFTVSTERQRVGAGYQQHIGENVQLNVDLVRETRKGVEVTAGALGRNLRGRGSGWGNPYAAELPEPIDSKDTRVDVKLGYAGTLDHAEIAYHASFFENANPALSWDDPSTHGGVFSGDNPNPLPAEGRLALPPSNQFHQVVVSGARRVDETTQITGMVSTGVMLQDEAFLPYRVGDETSALPRASLDGEVHVHAAQVGVTSRPTPPLRLNARYRYDERDNRTPQIEFEHYRLDASNALSGTSTNEPTSYVKQRAELETEYRFNPKVAAGIGYEYREGSRTFSEREETEQHQLEAQVKLKPDRATDLSLKMARLRRDGSHYQPAANQNPLLIKYDLAGLSQDRINFRLAHRPSAEFTTALDAIWTRNAYNETTLGLRDAERRAWTFDVSWAPMPRIALYAYLSREWLKATQFGSVAGELVDWQADHDDRIDAVGIGIKATDLIDRLDIGVDYVLMRGESALFLQRTHPTLNADVRQFPALRNELRSLLFHGDYKLRSDLGLTLTLLYEKLATRDWQRDDYAPDSVENLLLTGDEPLNASNYATAISVHHEF